MYTYIMYKQLCFAFMLGRNDKGQLGHGDMNRCDRPKILESLKTFTFVQASCGKAHSLVLTGKLT